MIHGFLSDPCPFFSQEGIKEDIFERRDDGGNGLLGRDRQRQAGRQCVVREEPRCAVQGSKVKSLPSFLQHLPNAKQMSNVTIVLLLVFELIQEGVWKGWEYFIIIIMLSYRSGEVTHGF